MDDGGGVFLPKRLPLLRAPFTPSLPPQNHPLYPLHFFSPTHSNRVAAALSSYTNIPTEKGQKTIYPLLLTNLPPPPLLPLQRLYWGRKRYPASLFPSLPPPCFSSPQFHTTTTHTCTHRLEHTRTYKLNPPGQQLYIR